jgi:hypothetical protein
MIPVPSCLAPSARIPSILSLPLSDADAKRFPECPSFRVIAKSPQVRGSWSEDDDENLLHAVSGHATIAWDAVAAKVGNHTAKQCRERWLVKLNPEVRRSLFEKWEDDLIRAERLRIGNHWSVIAQLLPGRTACSVKNRWYTVLRYQQLGGPIMRPPGQFIRPPAVRVQLE